MLKSMNHSTINYSSHDKITKILQMENDGAVKWARGNPITNWKQET